jgi:uncharacterized membrane protein
MLKRHHRVTRIERIFDAVGFVMLVSLIWVASQRQAVIAGYMIAVLCFVAVVCAYYGAQARQSRRKNTQADTGHRSIV